MRVYHGHKGVPRIGADPIAVSQCWIPMSDFLLLLFLDLNRAFFFCLALRAFNGSYLNCLVVFLTFFNLRLNLAIRSS